MTYKHHLTYLLGGKTGTQGEAACMNYCSLFVAGSRNAYRSQSVGLQPSSAMPYCFVLN